MSNFELEQEKENKARNFYQTYVSHYTSNLIFGTGEEEVIGKIKAYIYICIYTYILIYTHTHTLSFYKYLFKTISFSLRYFLYKMYFIRTVG